MKSFLINLALLLAGTATGLLLLEFGVRIALPHPQVIELAPAGAARVGPPVAPGDDSAGPVRVELNKRIDEPEGGIYLSTPTGRRLRPHSHAVIRNHHLCQCTTEIRTNSLGYRNPEIGTKTRTRVLFLGDSITLADYVPEEDTWVRQVETLSQSGSRPLETINSGVWAIGLANELAILLETGLRTDPDVVVLAWYLNDVQPSPGIHMIRAPRFLSWSWLTQYVYQAVSVLRSKLIQEDYGEIPYQTRKEWAERTAARFPPGDRLSVETPEGFNRSIQQLFGDWGAAWSDDAWEHMKPYFVELKRQADLHDFRLLVVAFPVQNQVAAPFVYDYPQQKLKQVADDLAVPVLDLLPLFREAHREWLTTGRDPRRKLFYDWCHHTPFGNRLIATWVHDFLQRELDS